MEYTELKFISDIEDIRIDQYLKSVSDSLSRTYIQKLIKDGCVMINGKNINKSSFTVNEDDEIILNLPNPLPLEILPQDIPLDIIYEDNDFLIVNKPKGMVVHPAPGHLNDTRMRLSSGYGIEMPLPNLLSNLTSSGRSQMVVLY